MHFSNHISSLGTSAKVVREVIRNSASAISDLEDGFGDSDHDSDRNIDPELLKQSRAAAAAPRTVPKTPAATVSEAKHTPLSNFRKQTNSSFGNIGEFMKMKMVSEDKKIIALDAKLQLEREKLELEKAKGKVDIARDVLAMAGASEQAKEAANAYLISLFS